MIAFEGKAPFFWFSDLIIKNDYLSAH